MVRKIRLRRTGGSSQPAGNGRPLALTSLLLATTTACTAVIVPPQFSEEPRPVFILDHGRHASLVLPAPDGRVVRYSYGDWRWYALRNTGPVQGSGALLWPTRAALGRRELAGPPSADSVRRQVRAYAEHVHEVIVEARDVEMLRRRLDSLFEAYLPTRIYNEAYDLEFVHHPEPYSAFRNSNQMVARWLRQLGCRLRGSALFSRWRVERGEGGEGGEKC